MVFCQYNPFNLSVQIFYEAKCATGKTYQTECVAGQNSLSFFFVLFFETIIHINTIIGATPAVGALQQILFVDVSPPSSLLDCSLCLDMLSLSDACSQASTGSPGIGGPR